MHTSGGPPRRVTLVRPGALGDTLLTLPALALLRAQASTPAARLQVTLIARAETLPLARASGLADAVWPWEAPDWGALFAFDAPLSALAETTLAQSDAVVVWARDPDNAIAQRLSALGVGQVIVAPPSLPNPLSHRARENAAPPTHTALWLAETLRSLGAQPPATLAELAQLTPPLRAPAEAVAQAEAQWRALGAPQQGVVALQRAGGAAAGCGGAASRQRRAGQTLARRTLRRGGAAGAG